MINFTTRFKNNVAFLEIKGEDDGNEYFVEFIDLITNNIEYSTNIKVNYWAKLDNISGKNILIKITLDDKVVFERQQDYKFNKVYIRFGSDSLGDSVAWIPYVDEYRKVNNVEVVLYTYFNELFDKAYPDIIFTTISEPNNINDVDKKFNIDYGPELYRVNNITALEEWYNNNKIYDNCVDYFDYRKISLQSIAPLILGLPIGEIVPKINIPEGDRKIRGKYVVVAMQSTAQLKYWNNPFGWERLFSFLKRYNYKILIIDRYKSYGAPGYFNEAPKSGKHVIDKTGNKPLSDRILDIKYADMVITISSGLAWVSWAVGTPVVMISGFTKPWNEFNSNNIRLYNSTVCNGCWNDPDIIFDASNWLFCPKNNDFICSKMIQPRDVIDAIKPLMK